MALSPPHVLPDARCFVEGPLQPGEVFLSAEEAHHLLSVRRKREGDEVLVLNGVGAIAHARIVHTAKRSVTLALDAVTRVERPRTAVTLCLANLKTAALELVLEKSVELGLGRLWLLQTDHSVAQVEQAKIVKKQARWTSKLVEAAKQSANPWLPELAWKGSVQEAIESLAPGTLSLAALLTEQSRPVREQLRERAAPASVALWVGPEGDFSLAEQGLLQESGALPLGLGPGILRAETAAIAFLSIVQAEWNW